MRLEGKRALVTGGARGIGLAMCRAFAAEGARVAIADLDAAECEAAAASLGEGHLGLRIDVTDQRSIDDGVARAWDWSGGGIDILVNNAAIFDAGPVLDITRDSYDRIFAVNVAGTLFPLQAVARLMVERGKGGKILNMASQAGRRGEALVATYCASKAAVISLTQSAALGLAPHGIQVNGIAPGVVDTPMWDQVDSLFARLEGKAVGQKKHEVGEAVPLGRMGRPEDIAPMAVFLASSDSDYVTAQTYGVDGGNWMA
jgi:D-sorbitol dehydrogenase (acceptor)